MFQFTVKKKLLAHMVRDQNLFLNSAQASSGETFK